MSRPAHAAGTFAIGGELTVHRLGFGAMRLPGMMDGSERGASRELLREAVRLGIDLIDTAHAYGSSEELIADALHPYPDGLVIATKGGLARGGLPDGRPERLRADCEESLRRLRIDTIDLWQLHVPDPSVSLEEQLGAIRELRDEGKIRFVGVSNVSVEQLRSAGELLEIATVQNRFNVAEQGGDDVLVACETEGIAFMPFAPIAMGGLADALHACSEGSPAMGRRRRKSRSRGCFGARRSCCRSRARAQLEHLRENVDAAPLALPVHKGPAVGRG